MPRLFPQEKDSHTLQPKHCRITPKPMLHTISDGFVMIYLYIETERDTKETACDFYKQQERGEKVIEEKDSGTQLTRQ